MPGTKPAVEINGYVVRALRIRDGLSMETLADLADVKRAYINKIEVGLSRQVSPKVFNALIAAFSLTDRRVLLADPHGASTEDVAA